MIKKELASELANRTGIAQNEARSAVNSLIEIIIETNSRGEEVNLRGLGTFGMVLRKGKPVQDIVRKQTIHMDDTWKPKFKPSKKLKEVISKLST